MPVSWAHRVDPIRNARPAHARGLATVLLSRPPMARRMADEESSVWLDVQVILPDQVTQRRVLDPERRLMLAVLHEAVLGYLAGAESTTRGHLREIEGWFASDDTRWPYSFANLCDGLGLDRSAVRRALFLQRLERLAS